MGIFCERRSGYDQEDLRQNPLPFYVYIVRCRDGSLYTGWTTDPEKRLNRHNAGTGARYTRSRRPVVLAYCEECPSREEAMSREFRIKRMTREAKRGCIRVEVGDILNRSHSRGEVTSPSSPLIWDTVQIDVAQK